MKKIENFILPEHTNKLYTNEAISSVSLTKEIAAKINELIDNYNNFSTDDTEWKLEMESNIRKAVVFMKDNLLNSLKELADLYEENGYINRYVEQYTQILEKRLDNIISSVSSDSEVIDGRVAFDGSTYDTLGVAIREQFNYVYDTFDSIIKLFINVRGKNLIDEWESILTDTTLNTNSGKIESYKGYYLYNKFIPVNGMDKHFILSPLYPISLYVHCYDKNKGYLGNVYTNKTVIPELKKGTKYIKPVFILQVHPKESKIQILEGSMSNKTTLNLYDTLIEPENCNFFISDIFPKENYTKGVAIASASGALVPFKDRTYTDFINVSNVKCVTSNFPFYVSYYDDLYNFMSSIKDEAYHRAGTLEIPEEACYMRLTLITEDDEVISTFTLSNGEYPAQSEPYMNPSYQPQSAFNTWYKGKKITAYGDSITELNSWQPFITKYFGCEMVNCGVGSSTVANNGLKKTVNGTEIDSWMCSDDRINLIPADSDIILLFGGANDSTSIEIGNVKTDMSDSTFMGAYSLMIKKIINKFPKARLIALTPIGGRTDNVNSNQDKQFYIYDKCMTDYAEAVKTVCGYYGVPCIDVNGESGINVLNHNTYIADIIHPNTEGGKRIANAVINGMKRFEPIEF